MQVGTQMRLQKDWTHIPVQPGPSVQG